MIRNVWNKTQTHVRNARQSRSPQLPITNKGITAELALEDKKGLKIKNFQTFNTILNHKFIAYDNLKHSLKSTGGYN